MRVIPAEVDGLGNVGLRLDPVLAGFVGHQRGEFELALSHEITDSMHDAGALVRRRTRPIDERRPGGVDRP